MGAGAGWIVGNSILKDLFEGRRFTRVINQIHAIAGIVPALGPILATALAELWGWRLAYLSLALLAALILATVFLAFPETLKERSSLSLRQVGPRYFDLLRLPSLRKFLTIKAFCVGLLFSEVSNLPLIYVEYMALSSRGYALLMMLSFFVYALGNLYNGKLCLRYPEERLIQLGTLMILLSNLTLFFCLFLHLELTAVHVQVIKLPTYLGFSFVFGNATAKIVSAASGRAGLASALMIALEMLTSSALIGLLSRLFDQTVFPLTLAMIAVSALVFAVATSSCRDLQLKGG